MNPFCINKKELIDLFWGGNTQHLVSRMLSNFSKKYSVEEIIEQMADDKSEVGKYLKEETDKFAKKTANDETGNALTLTDLYFPGEYPLVCFEMKRGFNKKTVQNYEELVENMESNTDIDCMVKNDKFSFKFQLKQYPEKYKKWSVEEVINYLDSKVLTPETYNNDSNKDLIIVITIKPEQQSNFKESEDFKKIHDHLMTKDIKLFEIDFLYNRNSEHIVWFQVFPEKGYNKIPWDHLSYHEAKK